MSAEPIAGFEAVAAPTALVAKPPPALIDCERIRAAVREILFALGEDPDREGLLRTPRRVADMYAELFVGIGRDPSEEIDVLFEENHDQMVVIREISFNSVCEHHLVPFIGVAHVAYIPNERGCVTGLSKIARVVDTAAARPQLQERLTVQIARALERALMPRGVLVVIEAEHLCMTMRGVRKAGARTITSAVRGMFAENDATRAEALALVTKR